MISVQNVAVIRDHSSLNINLRFTG